MNFITDPTYNYAKFKDSLEIDYDAMENTKFYEEVFAFAKFIAQAILENVHIERKKSTNLLQVKKALCNAIKTENNGSVMFILLVWCKTCAGRLICLKEKGKNRNAEKLCNDLDDFLDTIIDVIGKTLYAGMVNIVDKCN